MLVDAPSRALDFHAGKPGFAVKHDIPVGAHRRPALASPEEPEGIDPLQEPNEYPATRP